MKSFKDNQSRTWKIDLPYGEVLRVNESSGGKFHLLDPNADNLMQRLSKFDELFEMLSHLLAPQLEAAGIKPIDLAMALPGALLVEAKHAFFTEWRDFFQQIQRPDLAAALDVQIKTLTESVALLAKRIRENERLQNLMPDIDRAITKEFLAWEESLGSTHTPTHGANSKPDMPGSEDTSGK